MAAGKQRASLEEQEKQLIRAMTDYIDSPVLSTARELSLIHICTYEELTFRGFYEGTSYQEDYIHITLTDEEDIPDAVRKLQIIYPYLMKLDYDNKRTRAGICLDGAEDAEHKSPLELLEEFYTRQNGQPMGEEQHAFARMWMEQIWEEGEK